MVCQNSFAKHQRKAFCNNEAKRNEYLNAHQNLAHEISPPLLIDSRCQKGFALALIFMEPYLVQIGL